MFEYEFIQQRNAELQRAAEYAGLVRQARSARPGMLQRLTRSTRPAVATRRTVEPRLSEC